MILKERRHTFKNNN